MRNLIKKINLVFIMIAFLLSACNNTKSVVVYFSLVSTNSNNPNNEYDEVITSGSLNDGNLGFHVDPGETEKIELFYTDENENRTISCFHLPKGYAINLTNKYGNIIATYNSKGDSFTFKMKDLK